MSEKPSYSEFVAALCKPGEDIIKDLSPATAHLLHMGVGVAGEAGELLDALKKVAIYGRSVDRDNVIEELGDLEFYMEGVRQGLGITRQEVIDDNIRKLSARYHTKKYSNTHAQERADKADKE